jgi:tetratricopeptide (TPR) repeat protein
VLQLLESSRTALPDAFRDDPQTRMRLLSVLADTYHELNRFDIAMPMYEELVQMAQAQHDAHSPLVLQARFRQARTFQTQGLFDKAIDALEPLQGEFAETFGAQSEELRRLLYVLSTSYARAGRLDDADRMLADAGRMTEARFGRQSPQWMAHQNHLQVLRAGQGRLREALAAIQSTEPFWSDPRRENAREILVYRRNTIAILIRLGEYKGIEERTAAVLADMDRLLGPGNDMAAGLRWELARYFTETGQSARALAQREDNLTRAQAAGVQHPALLVPLQAHVLLARAQAWGHTGDPALARGLVKDARELLTRLDKDRDQIGYARADAWINLTRVGLALDDAALAAEALAPLRSDTGLRLDRDTLLASRVAQMEGQLARLQGDLQRSDALLRQRMKFFERPGDKQVLPGWVAALDLAYTLVLQRDASAAAVLADAAARRPQGIPAQHPLDRMAAWLSTQLVGADQSPPAGQTGLPAAREQGLGSFRGSLI